MSQTQRFALAFALSGFLGGLGLAADTAEDFGRLSAAGRDANRAGNYEKAHDNFEKAWQLAQKEGEPYQEELAASEAALNLRALAAQQPDGLDKEQKQKLIGYYQALIERGSSPAKETACNNLGVLYFRDKKFKEALEVFQKHQNPSNSDAATYHYNWGRALLENKSPGEAATHYWKSLEIDPTLTPAADRLVTLLLGEEQHSYARANQLLDLLLKQPPQDRRDAAKRTKANRLARACLFRFLEAWGNEAESASLLPRLLDYLELAHIGPNEFQAAEKPLFEKVLRHKLLAGAFVELNTLYLGDAFAKRKPLLFKNRSDVFDVFPRWSEVCSWHPSSIEVLSKLLKRAGDHYYRQSLPALPTAENPEEKPKVDPSVAAPQALARYSAAFALDVHNTEAAVYALSTLSEHQKELATEGDLLESLRQAILNSKLGLYAHAAKREDWDAILRCHLILAGIAETQGKWGPRTSADTVLFQLSAAQGAETRLRESLAKPQPPAAWLDDRLGTAYLKAGDPARAADAYARSVYGYLQIRDTGEAETARRNALKLVAEKPLDGWTPERRQQLERIGGVIANTAELRLAHSLPTTSVISVAFAENRLLWADRRTLSIWNPAVSPPDAMLPPERILPGWGDIQAMVPSPKGKVFACAWGSTIELWTMEGRPRSIREMDEGPRMVKSLAFDPDGQKLLGGASGSLTLWAIADGRILKKIEVPNGDGLAVAFAPQRGIVSTGAENQVLQFKADSGEKERTLEGHTGRIQALGYDPEGKVLASGSADRTVRLWNAETGKLRTTLPAGKGGITCLSFSPDGNWLVTGTDEGTAVLWDVGGDNGKEIAWLAPFRGKVASLAFSADGKRVVVGLNLGNNQGEVRFWDVTRLRQ